MHHNKWTHGRVTFEVSMMPAELRGVEGIAPMCATLDPSVGTEVVLFWIDRFPFIKQLVGVVPFDLRLKAGLVRTSCGPLLFLLFFVPNSARPNDPYVAVDCHVNPLQEAHMTLWRGLASQSHWHIAYLDEGLHLVDLKEFPNTFGIAETLEWVEPACKGMEGGSFDEAKLEFCEKYTIADLLAM